jgi:desulfoferrodoxin (superoxide reductase-like protein)
MKLFFKLFNFFFLIAGLYILSCKSSVDSKKINAADEKKQHYPIVEKTAADNNFINLEKGDIQYIDLMIDNDATVEIYYKPNEKILQYIDAIKAYLKTKKNTVKIIAVQNFPENIKPVERLYIQDTGDHLYLLYVFD